MPNLKRIYRQELNVQDLLELLEFGIGCAHVVGEVAVLSAIYLLGVQVGLSPMTALTVDTVGAAVYHRAQLGQFFSNAAQRLFDSDEEPIKLQDFRIG